MEPTELLASVAALLAVCSYAVIARSPSGPGPWWIPAVPLALFAAWTARSVAQDGPFGFWAEHVGTPWETQIWFDLLIMAGIAWWLAQPRLGRLGAPRVPWLLFIVGTGSIGALSMVLWIRHRETALAQRAPEAVGEPALRD